MLEEQANSYKMSSVFVEQLAYIIAIQSPGPHW
jgi:hypothetical protein